jgi:hypothetical protein
MSTNQDPTPAQAFTLFEEVEKKFPNQALGDESWYLVVVRQRNLDMLSFALVNKIY